MGFSSRYKGVIESGSRLVAEVEVGGWPVPTVTWFKDDEVLTTKTHTENYNGFPNKYVPDGRIEVIRLGKKLKKFRLSFYFQTWKYWSLTELDDFTNLQKKNFYYYSGAILCCIQNIKRHAERTSKFVKTGLVVSVFDLMSSIYIFFSFLDQIRHCIIFHRIGEGDSGVYSCQAVNPLGEAVCEAEFQIVPGEGIFKNFIFMKKDI